MNEKKFTPEDFVPKEPYKKIENKNHEKILSANTVLESHKAMNKYNKDFILSIYADLKKDNEAIDAYYLNCLKDIKNKDIGAMETRITALYRALKKANADHKLAYQSLEKQIQETHELELENERLKGKEYN